jgi:hypothetical protein
MLPAKHWLAYINARKALDVAVERLDLIARVAFQSEPSSVCMGFYVRAKAALTDIGKIIAG